MAQDELRKLYNERLIREKQSYISNVTHISSSCLSQFRHGRLEIYPKQYERLKEDLSK